MTRRRGKNLATLELEVAIHEIVAERAPITVRGIAYALFTRGLIDSMATKNTQKVSRITTAMRETGDLDWRLIVDNSRMVGNANTWDNPGQIIESAVRGYRRDYWQDQDYVVEVWSEKATVHGVLSPVLDEYGVTFRVMTGFGSHTSLRQAALATNSIDHRKLFVVFYLGDWDPSGKYMTDVDLPKRLERYGAECHFERIAVTEDDHDCPHFSAASKKSDPRYQWYSKYHGDRCWELDAIDPNDLRRRVAEQIKTCINLPKWERAIEVEKAEVQSMEEFYETWRHMMAG